MGYLQSMRNDRSVLIVDVESDGPAPGLFSMVSFAVVDVHYPTTKFFRGETRAIDGAAWKPEALAISGVSRDQHLAFPHRHDTMGQFLGWLIETYPDRPITFSDNPGYDFGMLNWYIWDYVLNAPSPICDYNPLGHSMRRIGDLFAGFKMNTRNTLGWKKYRKTKHTHDPLDDARGVAEALIRLSEEIDSAYLNTVASAQPLKP